MAQTVCSRSLAPKKVKPPVSPHTDPKKQHHLPKWAIIPIVTSWQPAEPSLNNVVFEQVPQESPSDWEESYEQNLVTWIASEDSSGKVLQGLKDLFNFQDDSLPLGRQLKELSSEELGKLNHTLSRGTAENKQFRSSLEKQEEAVLLGVPFATSDYPEQTETVRVDDAMKIITSRMGWWQSEMEGEMHTEESEVAGLQKYLEQLSKGGTHWRKVAHSDRESTVHNIAEDDEDLPDPDDPQNPSAHAANEPHVMLSNSHTVTSVQLEQRTSWRDAMPQYNSDAVPEELKQRLDEMERWLEFKDVQLLDAERYVQALKRRVWKLRHLLQERAPENCESVEDDVTQLRAEREWLYAKVYSLQAQNMQTVNDYIAKVKQHAMVQIRQAEEKAEKAVQNLKDQSLTAEKKMNKAQRMLGRLKVRLGKLEMQAMCTAEDESKVGGPLTFTVRPKTPTPVPADHSYTPCPPSFFDDLKVTVLQQRDLHLQQLSPAAGHRPSLHSPHFQQCAIAIQDQVTELYMEWMRKTDQMLHDATAGGAAVDLQAHISNISPRLDESFVRTNKYLRNLQERCAQLMEDELTIRMATAKAAKVKSYDVEVQTNIEQSVLSLRLDQLRHPGNKEGQAHYQQVESPPGSSCSSSASQADISVSSFGDREVSIVPSEPDAPAQDPMVAHATAMVQHDAEQLRTQLSEFTIATEAAGKFPRPELQLVSDALETLQKMLVSGQLVTRDALDQPHQCMSEAVMRPSVSAVPSVAKSEKAASQPNTAHAPKQTKSGPAAKKSKQSLADLRQQKQMGKGIPVPQDITDGNTEAVPKVTPSAHDVARRPTEALGQIEDDLSQALNGLSGGLLDASLPLVKTTGTPAVGGGTANAQRLTQLRGVLLQVSTCLAMQRRASTQHTKANDNNTVLEGQAKEVQHLKAAELEPEKDTSSAAKDIVTQATCSAKVTVVNATTQTDPSTPAEGCTSATKPAKPIPTEKSAAVAQSRPSSHASTKRPQLVKPKAKPKPDPGTEAQEKSTVLEKPVVSITRHIGTMTDPPQTDDKAQCTSEDTQRSISPPFAEEQYSTLNHSYSRAVSPGDISVNAFPRHALPLRRQVPGVSMSEAKLRLMQSLVSHRAASAVTSKAPLKCQGSVVSAARTVEVLAKQQSGCKRTPPSLPQLSSSKSKGVQCSAVLGSADAVGSLGEFRNSLDEIGMDFEDNPLMLDINDEDWTDESRAVFESFQNPFESLPGLNALSPSPQVVQADDSFMPLRTSPGYMKDPNQMSGSDDMWDEWCLHRMPKEYTEQPCQRKPSKRHGLGFFVPDTDIDGPMAATAKHSGPAILSPEPASVLTIQPNGTPTTDAHAPISSRWYDSPKLLSLHSAFHQPSAGLTVKVGALWLEFHHALFAFLLLLKKSFRIPFVVDELTNAIGNLSDACAISEPAKATTAQLQSSAAELLSESLVHDLHVVQGIHSYFLETLRLTQRLTHGKGIRPEALQSIKELKEEGEGLDAATAALLVDRARAQSRVQDYISRMLSPPRRPTTDPSVAPVQEKVREVYIRRSNGRSSYMTLPSSAPPSSDHPKQKIIPNDAILKRALAHIQKYEESSAILPDILAKYRPQSSKAPDVDPAPQPTPSSKEPVTETAVPVMPFKEERREKPSTTVELAAAIQRSFGSFL